MEQEEIWVKHYERAKTHLNVNKLWSEIEKKNTHKGGCVFRRFLVRIFTSTYQGGCDQCLFIV